MTGFAFYVICFILAFVGIGVIILPCVWIYDGIMMCSWIDAINNQGPTTVQQHIVITNVPQAAPVQPQFVQTTTTTIQPQYVQQAPQPVYVATAPQAQYIVQQPYTTQ